MMRIPLLLALGLFALGAQPVAAQASYDSLAVEPGFCFRGRPANRCSGFMIIDAGFHYRISEPVPGDERQLYHWAIGLMDNNSPATALGALVFVSAEGEGRAGAALRWRKWLTQSSAVDLTGGFTMVGEASSGSVGSFSPTLQARVVLGDLIAVSARYDILRIRGGCETESCFPTTNFTDSRFYVGAEAGSFLGATGFIATGVLFILFIIAFAGIS